MSRTREYVGCKSIEAVNYDGDGNTLFNMWVTDEEIVRCRDCKYAYDIINDKPICSLRRPMRFLVKPNGFCSWGERND